MLRTSAVLVVGSTAGCLEDIREWQRPAENGHARKPTNGETQAPADVLTYERTIHGHVNAAREDRDRDALEYHDDIATVARRHSEDMIEREYFAHESPDGEGPQDRMSTFFPGYCRGVGENLAMIGIVPGDDADALADRVVSGWLDSPGHRENLLRPAFDEEGIGVAIADGERLFATQKLCARIGLLT